MDHRSGPHGGPRGMCPHGAWGPMGGPHGGPRGAQGHGPQGPMGFKDLGVKDQGPRSMCLKDPGPHWGV